jgi:hypothetical protein
MATNNEPWTYDMYDQEQNDLRKADHYDKLGVVRGSSIEEDKYL